MRSKLVCHAIFACAVLAGCSPSEDAIHKQVVSLHLNDPSSAVFRGGFKSKSGTGVWCGEVNARNKMGGMVGFTRYIVYLPGPNVDVFKDTDSALNYSQIFFGSSENDTFPGKWTLLCVQ
jgi:hypothetical protein